MNGKNKNATKLCDTKDKAEKWIVKANDKRVKGGKKPNDYTVVYRKGVHKKCEEYCKAASFCNYYWAEVAETLPEAAIPF
jgi:hypothetical protein